MAKCRIFNCFCSLLTKCYSCATGFQNLQEVICNCLHITLAFINYSKLLVYDRTSNFTEPPNRTGKKLPNRTIPNRTSTELFTKQIPIFSLEEIFSQYFSKDFFQHLLQVGSCQVKKPHKIKLFLNWTQNIFH